MYVTCYHFEAMLVGRGVIEIVVLNDKIVKTSPLGREFLDKKWSDVIKRVDIRDERITYAS